MDKKKKLIISILGVLVIIAVVSSASYAYFRFVTNSGNIESTAGKLDIDYNISEPNLTGTLIPSATRSGGVLESITAKLKEGSVDGAINLYINPTEVVGIPLGALSYDVDVIDTSSNVINHYSGDFSTATINTPYKIVDAYDLSTNLLTFNIYIWLDGSKINNENFNSTNHFNAIITADSVHITGEF